MTNYKIDDTGLVPIYKDDQDDNLVNARDLHEGLEIKRQFSDWVKDQIHSLELVENLDWQSFTPKSDKPLGGRISEEYLLTLDTAKHIALASRTDKGKQIRKYFIDVEKKSKNILANISRKDLAFMVIKSEEEKEALQQITYSQQKQITTLKPKADMHDRFMQANNNVSMGTLAKVLNIKGLGRNNLFKKLKEIGMLMKNNQPKQEYINAGYFEVIVKPIAIGQNVVNQPITLVTAKGQNYIYNKLKQYFNL